MSDRAGMGTGMGLTALLAVGAAFYSQGSHLPPAPPLAPSAQTQTTNGHRHYVDPDGTQPYAGNCSAYLPPSHAAPGEHEPDELRGEAFKVIRAYFEEGTPTAKAAAVAPAPGDAKTGDDVKDEGEKETADEEHLEELVKGTGTNTGKANDYHMRYVIATIPDPRRTHLALDFDRDIDSIQAGAQARGYVYDSSWLPWSPDGQKYPLREDESAEENKVSAQGSCPGVLLFRHKVQKNEPQERIYHSGLMVFIVGEQPTGGLNRNEWENAITWLNDFAWKAPDKEGYDPLLRVLGPTTSGSLPSLEGELEKWRADGDEPSSTQPKTGYIFSGSVQGYESIRWFKSILGATSNTGLHFFAFRENDAVKTCRLLRYLQQQGTMPDQVAEVSEDETTYGSFEFPASPQGSEKGPVVPSPCLDPDPEKSVQTNRPYVTSEPIQLYYPRDISELRTAYQEHSLFSHLTGNNKGSDEPHTVLPADLSARDGERGDSIPSFSKQAAIDQEAQMYGLVSQLKAKHVRYILLRGTNSLDYLFLTRFLHQHYPDAHIITLGADLLFRREVDTTEFRGTLALTEFPLTPNAGKATYMASGSGIRQAEDDENVAIETAMIALLSLKDSADPHCSESGSADDRALGPSQLENDQLPNYYEHAAWLTNDPASAQTAHFPDAWLTVIGRDGYWPVAALSESAEAAYVHKKELPDGPAPTIAKLFAHREGAKRGRLTVPDTWWIFLVISIALLSFHVCANLNPRLVRFTGFARAFARGASDWPKRVQTQHAVMQGFLNAVALLPVWILMLPLFEFHNTAPASIGTTAVLCMLLSVSVALRTYQNSEWKEALSYTSFATLFMGGTGAIILAPLGPASARPFVYRAVHLSSGVSPLLPMWLLFVGLYLWALLSQRGNHRMGAGRPLLPDTEIACSPCLPNLETKLRPALHRTGCVMAERIERLSRCLLPCWTVVLPLLIFIGCFILFSCLLLDGALPLRSFEGKWFDRCFVIVLVLIVALILLEATRIVATTWELKLLLDALARTPLRRTFRALRDVSVRSVLHMSGSLSRRQYQFLWRQGEVIQALCGLDDLPLFHNHDISQEQKIINDASETIRAFRCRHATSLDAPIPWSQPLPDDPGRSIREVVRDCSATLFSAYLKDEWDRKRAARALEELERDPSSQEPLFPLSSWKHVRLAEEFVCLTYIAYIQNLMTRLRDTVMSMGILFVAAAFSVALYPFTPRPDATLFLLILLAGSVAVIATVYSSLERDCVLSDITDTKARLGWEFYQRLLIFLVPTVFALLATYCPGLSDTLLGWMRPGIEAIK